MAIFVHVRIKMKHILIILTFTLIGVSSIAQKIDSWSELDTIRKFPDKTLIHFVTYNDSIIIKECQAYFFPIKMEFPRFRIFQQWLTKEIDADSLVYHGETITYLDEGYFMIETFENGSLRSKVYFDSSGKEIPEHPFPEKKENYRGPGGDNVTHYFIREL